jgi:hypothetical protein
MRHRHNALSRFAPETPSIVSQASLIWHARLLLAVDPNSPFPLKESDVVTGRVTLQSAATIGFSHGSFGTGTTIVHRCSFFVRCAASRQAVNAS